MIQQSAGLNLENATASSAVPVLKIIDCLGWIIEH